jgi:hypothetical protein
MVEKLRKNVSYSVESSGLDKLIFDGGELIFRHRSENYVISNLDLRLANYEFRTYFKDEKDEKDKYVNKIQYPVYHISGKFSEEGCGNFLGILRPKISRDNAFLLCKGINEVHIYVETIEGYFEGKDIQRTNSGLVFGMHECVKKETIDTDFYVHLKGQSEGASLFKR